MLNNNQSYLKKLSALFFLSLAQIPLYAAGTELLPSGMKDLVDNLVLVFTGDFVKGILVVFLCGCAVAYAFNKDNEKMKRNCIAIGIAIALLMGASFIVGKIMEASK